MTTATWRLARQTSRWCRFAVVTVDVTPAERPEVRMSGVAGMRAEHREVELGVHAGLRALGTEGRLRVTVTGVRATMVDTGIGDLHEAAARAVWQAAGATPRPPGYAGFGEPELVAAWLRDHLGLRVEEVIEARQPHPGRGDDDTTPQLAQMWLHLAGRPPTMLHAAGDALRLSVADPADEQGEPEVRVAPPAPTDPLAGLVGRRLTGGAVLVNPGTGDCAGLLLRTGGTELLVARTGGRWVVARDVAPGSVEPSWQVRSPAGG